MGAYRSLTINQRSTESTAAMDNVVDGKDVAEVTQKDLTYSLEWDCIILKVEDTLFKIPRALLSLHSQFFRDLFQSPFTGGASEENPLIVQSGITVTDLRRFLQITLPLATENLEAVPTGGGWKDGWKDEWISVLKVSTLWRFLSLRKIAIQAIESKISTFGMSLSRLTTALTATEQIVLGRRYFVSSWVEAGYTELAKNGDISDWDMKQIGSEVSFKLMRISLGCNKQSKLRFKLKETIETIFEAELQSIAAAEEDFFVPEKVEEDFGSMGEVGPNLQEPAEEPSLP